MKVKLSATIEIDEKKYPNLTKKVIREELHGNFDLYMQHIEVITKDQLDEMNRGEK